MNTTKTTCFKNLIICRNYTNNKLNGLVFKLYNYEVVINKYAKFVNLLKKSNIGEIYKSIFKLEL